MHGACIHLVGRALSSDWSENTFVIVVFMEKTFVVPLDRKFWLRMKNNFLIDNHYKTIYGLVRIECSPCRVELWSVPDTRIGFKSRFRLHCHYRFFFKFLVSKDKIRKSWIINQRRIQFCTKIGFELLIMNHNKHNIWRIPPPPWQCRRNFLWQCLQVYCCTYSTFKFRLKWKNSFSTD